MPPTGNQSTDLTSSDFSEALETIRRNRIREQLEMVAAEERERLRSLEETRQRLRPWRIETTAFGRGGGGGNGPGGDFISIDTPFPTPVEEFEDDDISPEILHMIDLKKSHLSRDMRSMMHKPKSDWYETPKGEVCKNASTLVIDDIIAPIKK